MTRHATRLAHLLTASAAVLSAAVLAGCASTEPSAPSSTGPEPSDRETTETAGPSERLAITYDGGLMVLDPAAKKVLSTFEASGFTRLNPAGDNRHVFLTEGDAFRLLDLGTWSLPHGDHSHSYATDPVLSTQTINGSHPGHLVSHDGTTTAFFDGSGEIHSFDPLTLAADRPINTQQAQAKEAHHGVAVVRKDGSMIHTVGNADTRTGVVIVDKAGRTVAENSDCPGVHGEAAVKDGVVSVGCENGLLLITGNTIKKVASPDDHGRIGNQRGHEASSVILGDYKTDPEAEVERPTRVSLTDARNGKLSLVDLPAAYSFRSLGRGPGGAALVHGTDGKLRVINPESGTIDKEIPVTGTWEEPKEWQSPQPTLLVSGDTAYITEPAAKKLHRVDLAAGKVSDSIDLPEAPSEIAAASGEVPAGAEEKGFGLGHEHTVSPGAGHDHGEKAGHGKKEGHGEKHDHGEKDGHGH